MSRMTKRQRYLAVLSGAKADALTWAPNFDHWLAVNTANGTVPAEYAGLSRNDIVRATGASIWGRTSVLKTSTPNVEVSSRRTGDRTRRTTYRTSAGQVETETREATDLTRALFLTEHMVKSPSDIAVVKSIVEDTTFELDAAPFLRSDEEVGDDGISLVGLPYCVPFIQFAKSDAGWVNGIYLWNDHTALVEDLMEAYTRKNLEAAALIAKSPALIVNSGDNMDEWTMPPNLFAKYAVPYYRQLSAVLHAGGKLLEVHWCGRTQHLLSLVAGTGIDIVESLVTRPMADISMPEALDILRGVCVVQGGVPAVLMCESGGTRDDLRRYLDDLLSSVPHTEGFALGMADNVPPDADFERVRIISDMVAQVS